MSEKIVHTQRRGFHLSRNDIHNDGTLTPQAQHFLSLALPHAAQEFTTALRPRSDVTVTIILEVEDPR